MNLDKLTHLHFTFVHRPAVTMSFAGHARKVDVAAWARAAYPEASEIRASHAMSGLHEGARFTDVIRAWTVTPC